MIYLNEPSNSALLDEWTCGVAKVEVSSSSSSKALDEGRSGLGFTKKRVESEKKDALGAIIKGKGKKRGETYAIAELSSDDDEGELHGIVEKEITRGESPTKKVKSITKASAVSDGKNSSASQKPKTKPEAQCTTKADEYADLDKNVDTKSDGQEPKKENHRKRIRVKTRSKQKNIRRDNRPDSQKPTRLQVGSDDYQGRPLTQVTKKIIGFQESKNTK